MRIYSTPDGKETRVTEVSGADTQYKGPQYADTRYIGEVCKYIGEVSEI